MFARAGSLAFGLCFTASLAVAQTTLQTLHGPLGSNGHSLVADFAGDVNNDGVEDWIVGVYLDDTFGQNAGQVFVYSGADGAVLHSLHGGTDDYYGNSVDGVGDVNGDGHDDFIVGALRAEHGPWNFVGEAYVYSGATGGLLYTVGGVNGYDSFGNSVSGVGDVSGDGVPDFAVGAPGRDQGSNDNKGSVSLYSGVDGSLIREDFGTTHIKFGYDVDGVGDVDGDGRGDFVATALHVTQPNASGEARLISGATGAELHKFTPALTFYWFGVSCAGVGDVNGDGTPDVAVGEATERTVGYNGGAVHVYSGADGSELQLLVPSFFGGKFGTSVAGAGDVNGDGTPDIVVGSPRGQWGYAGQGNLSVHSGLDGSLVFQVFGQGYGDELGTWVAGGGDLTGDGLSEVLGVAPFTDGNGSNAGSVRVLTLSAPECVAVTSYCSGLPNSAGPGCTLSFSGTTSEAANDLFLHATGAVPSQPGLYFFGPNQASQPFGNGLRCVGGPFNRLGVAITSSFGHSGFQLDVTAPQAGGLLTNGSTWNFQLYYRDPNVGASFNASDALSVTFCP